VNLGIGAGQVDGQFISAHGELRMDADRTIELHGVIVQKVLELVSAVRHGGDHIAHGGFRCIKELPASDCQDFRRVFLGELGHA
jgi:hypothetical protein